MKYSFNVYQQDPPNILPLELAAGGREVLPTYLARSACELGHGTPQQVLRATAASEFSY